MNRTKLALKGIALYGMYRFRDARRNRRLAAAGRRILVVRHSGKQPYRFLHFLQWLEREFPDVRARLELRLLPCPVRDWSRYALHVPWLQDPVEDWSPGGYRRSLRMAETFARHGVPTINRVDRLSNGVKSVGSGLIAGTGIRTPRTVTIRDAARFREDLGGLALPLLIREDRGHGRPTFFVERPGDLDRAPLDRYVHPIAVEYVDVRSPDGLNRKYRYLATGETGVTRHLMVGSHWEVRPENRVVTGATRDEELAFLDRPDPNRTALDRARRALGLDVVAFDYSYDRRGKLVVWEANAYPDLRYPKNAEVAHLGPYVRRSYAAVARMYLRRAGLPVPGRMNDLLAGQGDETRETADAILRAA